MVHDVKRCQEKNPFGLEDNRQRNLGAIRSCSSLQAHSTMFMDTFLL